MIFLKLYKFTAFIILLFVSPYAWFKIKSGSILWSDRFGLGDYQKADVWIHAASVGEVKVISYLVDFLLAKKPELKIHVTVMTETGYATAKSIFKEQVNVSFLPLDSGITASKVVEKINPGVMVIAETEIWFNFLHKLFSKKIPVILINGRMSSKAFGKYKFINKAMSVTLSKYSKLFVKSDSDASHFKNFNLPKNLLKIIGDMKFDAPIIPRSEGRRQEIRHRYGINENDYLLVAGSTRPREEEILLELFKKINSDNFKLILAPRHIERSEQIMSLIEEQNLPFDLCESSTGKKIVLIDKLGLLNDLYVAADLAFVGGTMVEIGGHNILEPVWAGTPVIYGPSVANVIESSLYIEKNNYGLKVSSKEELFKVVKSIYLGEKKFNIKKNSLKENSPTAMAGEEILRVLQNV